MRPAKGKAQAEPLVAELEARVIALEKAVLTLCVHLPAAFLDEEGPRVPKWLDRVENRLSSGATLARIELPETTYDEVFEEWEALPFGPKERWNLVRARLEDHFVEIGVCTAEELGRR